MFPEKPNIGAEMRTMSPVEHRLSEELEDLMRYLRQSFAYEQMSVEDYEVFMAVYAALRETVAGLEEATLH